ncbi:MAG: hypothetical protein JXB47_06055 [Anaerolineae bacterium]|nr:hypothetical protein [Anaerolineae bacterium]
MADKRFKTNSFVGAVQVALALVTAPLARLWYNAWGATAEEVKRALPGDDIVPRPKLAYTRAVAIRAPAADIWPWLAQLGQGRGGLYSYDGLENLAGCDIHSAGRILPECQDLKAGDHIRFGPAEKKFPGQVVAALEPGKYLLMYALDPATRQASESATWVLYLDEKPDGVTRLIARARNGYEPGLMNHILWHIVEPLNFVMERRMLLGIKARAEALGG